MGLKNWLNIRALSAPAEDPALVLSTHSSSRQSNNLFQPVQELGTKHTHTHSSYMCNRRAVVAPNVLFLKLSGKYMCFHLFSKMYAYIHAYVIYYFYHSIYNFLKNIFKLEFKPSLDRSLPRLSVSPSAKD